MTVEVRILPKHFFQENQLNHDLVNLALLSTHEDMLDSARYVMTRFSLKINECKFEMVRKVNENYKYLNDAIFSFLLRMMILCLTIKSLLYCTICYGHL